MTEGEYTQELVRALRGHLPTSVVFKHADQFTAGVPDLSVTLHGLTTWFEAKRLDDRHVTQRQPLTVVVKPARDVRALQWETLRRLGRGFLIVYTGKGHHVTHVAGLREQTLHLRLGLLSFPALVARVVKIVKSTQPEAW